MSDRQAPVSVRLNESDLERADALVAAVAQTDVGAMGEVTRAVVLRLAVRRGLDALEAEHPKRGRR